MMQHETEDEIMMTEKQDEREKTEKEHSLKTCFSYG